MDVTDFQETHKVGVTYVPTFGPLASRPSRIPPPPSQLKSNQRQRLPFPSEPRQQELVNSMIGDLSAAEMETFLTGFTQWDNRYP
jgi:hypothetical protein